MSVALGGGVGGQVNLSAEGAGVCLGHRGRGAVFCHHCV